MLSVIIGSFQQRWSSSFVVGSIFYNFILVQMLKSSMLAAQAAQLKELDAMFERDNKEMKSTQAKVSVVVFLHIGNKDMKGTPAKVVLNLNLSLKLLWLLATKACTPLRPICWCHGRSRCVWCCFGFCRWNTRICKQYPDIGGDRPRCTSGQKPEDESREGENHQGEECKQHQKVAFINSTSPFLTRLSVNSTQILPRFIDERKSQAIKQSHRREKLKKEHAKQVVIVFHVHLKIRHCCAY